MLDGIWNMEYGISEIRSIFLHLPFTMLHITSLYGHLYEIFINPNRKVVNYRWNWVLKAKPF